MDSQALDLSTRQELDVLKASVQDIHERITKAKRDCRSLQYETREGIMKAFVVMMCVIAIIASLLFKQ